MKKKSQFYKEHPYSLYQSRENADFPHPANSKGFVGKKEYSLIKNKNIKRILVLGGSTVEGLPPHFENLEKNPNLTWTHLLEENLNNLSKRENYKFKFEVLNLGCSGYTSYESLFAYICRGKWFKPDLVISYQGVNDIVCSFLAKNFQEDYSHVRENNFPKVSSSLWNSPLYSPLMSLSQFLNRILVVLKIKKPDGLIYAITKKVVEFDDIYDASKISIFLENIKMLDTLCKSNNSILLNISMVWDDLRPFIMSHAYVDARIELKSKVTSFYNQYFYELNSKLLKEKDLLSYQLQESDFYPHYYYDGIHFNLEGIKKIAKVSSDYIFENKQKLFK